MTFLNEIKDERLFRNRANIFELRVFVTAAEALNFSRAAARLQLSQSAVSQNIHRLERIYGVELFVRHRCSVQLSDAGQAILPMAREVLNSVRLLDDALVNINGEVAGELMIGCSTTSGKYVVSSLLADFSRQFPRVRTRVPAPKPGFGSLFTRIANTSRMS